LTQWEKVVLEAGYHFTYIDYHTDKFASLDRTENEIPVRAVYKYTDSTAFYIKSAWKLCEFRNPGLNNFYIVDSRVGLAKDFTDRSLNFDVNIGVAVARIKNDNGMNPSVRATHIVWDSAFSYQPNEQLAFVAAAYGTPRVNLAVTQPIRPVYGARLDITAKLLERKLKVSVSGNYERIDNLPIDSDQVFMTGNARVQYQFRTWAFGYTAYTLTTRQADGTVLDYVDNKVVVGVGAVL
ncbi:MAG TPA: hypothetical protein VL860_09315, partial [Planctomycetota bacterium]|nr:hypothetical protein [Planctomycetota bacterium]